MHSAMYTSATLLALVSGSVAQATEGFLKIDKPDMLQRIPKGNYDITMSLGDKSFVATDPTVKFTLLAGTEQALLQIVGDIAGLNPVSVESPVVQWDVTCEEMASAAKYGELVGLRAESLSHAGVIQYSKPFYFDNSACLTSSTAPSTMANPTSSATSTTNTGSAEIPTGRPTTYGIDPVTAQPPISSSSFYMTTMTAAWKPYTTQALPSPSNGTALVGASSVVGASSSVPTANTYGNNGTVSGLTPIVTAGANQIATGLLTLLGGLTLAAFAL